MSSDGDEHSVKEDIIMKDETGQAGTSAEVSAANKIIRLTPFWTNNPRIWFVTTEVQFSLQKIWRDDDMYGHTVLALTPEAAETVIELLKNPPSSNKYETLKAALIDRNSPSEEKNLEQLLDKTDIGDKKPSEVLRQIKSLAGDKFELSILKSLWIRKMPEFIRIALIGQPDDKTSEELAKTADKLHEALATTHAINSIRQSRPIERSQSFRPKLYSAAEYRPSTSHASMEDRMDRLEKMIARLSYQSRSRSRNRYSASRQRSNSLSNKGRDRNHNYCWFHRRFGGDVKYFKKPCNHPKSKYYKASDEETDKKSPNQ